MSLCQAIFQKTIYDLTVEDLELFFSKEQEESSVLEFKSGDTSAEVVYKEISAFLNTEGGILIVGAPREERVDASNGKKMKVCKGALTPSAIASQDALMRGIGSNIAPAPVGVKAKTIPHGTGHTFVLEGGQSMTPPHQYDGRYYIRLEREAKAAPHGIVEALFQKRQRPLLTAKIEARRKLQNKEKLLFSFEVTNDSVISADIVGYEILLLGVKDDVVRLNGKDSLRWEDEKLSTLTIHSGEILVKGLTFRNGFEVIPTTNVVMAAISYYCKDVVLEQKFVLFDCKTGKFIRVFDSKRPDEGSTFKEIGLRFEELQKEWIEAFLGHPSIKNASLSPPATDGQLRSLLSKFETDFPRSYLTFLRLTNGFECIFNGRQVNFWESNVLEEVETYDYGTKYLKIGTSDVSDYIVRCENNNFEFGYLPANVPGWQGAYKKIGNTFYDLLDFALGGGDA